MINNISWSTYWSTIIILSAIYYLVIGFKYFRSDLVQALIHPIKKNSQNESTGSALTLSPVRNYNETQVATVLQQATDEVKACLEQLAISNTNKETLLLSLQQIIRKYPQLKGSDYQQAFSHNIQLECDAACAIELSADELKELWNDR